MRAPIATVVVAFPALLLAGVALAQPTVPPPTPAPSSDLPPLPPPSATPDEPPAGPAPAPSSSPQITYTRPAPTEAPPPYEAGSHEGGDIRANDLPSAAPEARTGFQMALRLGLAWPMGYVQEGQSMSDSFGTQVPFTLDIGGKISRYFFLGAYLTLAGGAVGNYSRVCDAAASGSCVSVAVRLGIEGQWSFQPGEHVNPWIGYGIGIAGEGDGGPVNNQAVTFTGVDFAHIMGGLDFRLSKVIGIGPYADLSFGRYSDMTVTDPDGTKHDTSIDNRRTHGWFTIGARLVFFP